MSTTTMTTDPTFRWRSSPLRTPRGISERFKRCRTILNKRIRRFFFVQTMIMNGSFRWSHVLLHVVYVRNEVPKRKLSAPLARRLVILFLLHSLNLSWIFLISLFSFHYFTWCFVLLSYASRCATRNRSRLFARSARGRCMVFVLLPNDDNTKINLLS